MTVREHCKAIYERTGKLPALLRNAPQCPEGLYYLWETFLRLRRRCTPSMGMARILYADFQSYMTVTSDRLAAWEIEIIERLDDALCIARSK